MMLMVMMRSSLQWLLGIYWMAPHSFSTSKPPHFPCHIQKVIKIASQIVVVVVVLVTFISAGANATQNKFCRWKRLFCRHNRSFFKWAIPGLFFVHFQFSNKHVHPDYGKVQRLVALWLPHDSTVVGLQPAPAARVVKRAVKTFFSYTQMLTKLLFKSFR